MFAVCCKPQASDRSDDEEPASTMKATLVEKSPAKKPEKSTTPPSLHTEILLRRLSNEDVFKKYRVEKVLGQGSMGSVSLVSIRHGKIGGSAFESKSKGFLGLFRRRKRTGKLKEDSTSPHTYALKSIILDRVSNTFLMELQNEIEILRTLDHPNIVKLHEVYTYMKQIYLVLESCDGGDLYARSPYSEREAGKIMAQLLSAVSYMHEHGVVHRDLKFENIMFESTREDARIKVIDFGLSKKFIGEPKYMTECVGTIYTMAPAVLQGIYSSNADLWSAGVIAYMLLSATKPFWHKRRKRMIDMIMRCHYTMEGGVWESISPAAKDFVSHLIVLDPKERYSAAQALKHEWIVNRERLPNERPTEALLESIDGSLLNYKNTSALKKIALTVIAHRSNTGDIMELRNAFSAFDTENDGTISFEEFKEGLKKLKYSDEMLKDIFSSIDVNKNGKINYTEVRIVGATERKGLSYLTVA